MFGVPWIAAPFDPWFPEVELTWSNPDELIPEGYRLI
jgi:hypothetical protein